MDSFIASYFLDFYPIFDKSILTCFGKLINSISIPTKTPGTCSELPTGRHLITDSVFPVRRGVEVFVNCVAGFTLTGGDRMITCVQDSEYTSSTKLPECSIGV